MYSSACAPRSRIRRALPVSRAIAAVPPLTWFRDGRILLTCRSQMSTALWWPPSGARHAGPAGDRTRRRPTASPEARPGSALFERLAEEQRPAGGELQHVGSGLA